VREIRRQKLFMFPMFLSINRLTFLKGRLRRQRDPRKNSSREGEKKAVAVVGYTLLQILARGSMY
jgi:hypothetical protein